jgi:hypothetical protein
VFVRDEAYDPSDITGLIDVPPTRQFVKGTPDPRSRSGKLFPASGWILDSEPHIASRNPDDHLEWLLAFCEERVDAFKQLLSDGWSSHIDVLLYGVHGLGGGPVFTPDHLRRLGRLDIFLFVSICGLDDGPEAESSNPAD